MYAALALVLATMGIFVLIGQDDEEPEGDGSDDEIRGTFGDDLLTGTEGDDVIFGWLGDDTIDGLDGDDEIRPGEGDDTVYAGLGRDVIFGSPGEDELYGEVGNDTISGGADNDYINGGYGSDELHGGAGNDTIFGGFDARDVNGEIVPALQSQDLIRGDDGDDTIYIWGGDGVARGNDGEDDLILVTGAATLEAGAGVGDHFYVLANVTDDQMTEATIEDFDPSRDTLTLTMDYVPDGGTPPDVDVTMTETSINGVNGVLVEAVYVGPGDIPAESEGAVAFLQGLTVDALSAANIDVQVTDQADLFDPVSTMAALVV